MKPVFVNSAPRLRASAVILLSDQVNDCEESIPFIPSRRGLRTRRIEGLIGLAGQTLRAVRPIPEDDR